MSICYDEEIVRVCPGRETLTLSNNLLSPLLGVMSSILHYYLLSSLSLSTMCVCFLASIGRLSSRAKQRRMSSTTDVAGANKKQFKALAIAFEWTRENPKNKINQKMRYGPARLWRDTRIRKKKKKMRQIIKMVIPIKYRLEEGFDPGKIPTPLIKK